jgi:hypothetical protein
MINTTSTGQTVNLQSSINCPGCGHPIYFPIQALLQAKSLTCTNCFLELEIDLQKSGPALQGLRKLASSLEEK